jgi:hypothetical protein
MAQAVSRRPLTTEARVRSQVKSMWDLWWTKWHWDRLSSELSVFPCRFHSTGAPLIVKIGKKYCSSSSSSSSQGCTISCGASVASAAGPPHKKKKTLFELSNYFDAWVHWRVWLIYIYIYIGRSNLNDPRIYSWGDSANLRNGELRIREEREKSVFICWHSVPTHKTWVFFHTRRTPSGGILAAGWFTWPHRKENEWHKCQGQRQGEDAKYRFRTTKFCVVDRSDMPNRGHQPATKRGLHGGPERTLIPSTCKGNVPIANQAPRA